MWLQNKELNSKLSFWKVFDPKAVLTIDYFPSRKNWSEINTWMLSNMNKYSAFKYKYTQETNIKAFAAEIKTYCFLNISHPSDVSAVQWCTDKGSVDDNAGWNWNQITAGNTFRALAAEIKTSCCSLKTLFSEYSLFLCEICSVKYVVFWTYLVYQMILLAIIHR